MSLKIGIVGFGNIGGGQHAPVYDKNDKCEITAICDIDKEKADIGAEKYGAKAFYSVEEMLKSGIKLDACSMATKGEENGGDHFEPTMQLLKAGIPVLGEKPISNSIKEGEKMVALAKKKKIPYAIDLNHRFTPAALKAKEWINEGRIGEINMINMRMWINNPVETSPWFHMRALHPHSFDVIRYFAGDVDNVGCFLKKGPGRITYSNAQVLLHFESGAIGTLTGSYDAGKRESYGLEKCEIVGSGGRIVIDDACKKLSYNKRGCLEIESYEYLGEMFEFGETFESRINHWVDQIEAGIPYDKIEASGLDALRAQKIIEAAIESFKTDRFVKPVYK